MKESGALFAVLCAMSVLALNAACSSPRTETLTSTTSIKITGIAHLPTPLATRSRIASASPGPGETPLPATASPPQIPPGLGPIAFVSVGTDQDGIYMLTTGGGPPLPLIVGTRDIVVAPAWSPDAGWIAFAADFESERGVLDIYLIRADGGGLTRLTSDPADEDQPSWSRDSQFITFAVGGRFRSLVFLMNTDGTGRRQLTQGTPEELFPVWSREGGQIAFLCGSPPYNICLSDISGSNVRRLQSVEADFGPITWSPDGHHIAFTRYLYCTLAIVDIDSEETADLTEPSGCDRDPS